MNPILKEAIGSILRKLLTGWAVWLVAKGYWTDAEVSTYVEAAIVFLFSLALTVWKIYGDRVWKMVALTMPVGATENDVKAKIKSGDPIPTITTPPNTIPGVPKLPLLFLLAAIGLGLSGCVTGARLEAGGPYAASPTQAAMPELFVLDSSFDLAYTALDVVFKYEKSNRAALWQISPDIKHSIDKLRLEAQRVVLDYSLARTAYLASPEPELLDSLSIAVSKLQALNSAALAVISTKGQI